MEADKKLTFILKLFLKFKTSWTTAVFPDVNDILK
jgi:hypothetical protein